MTWIVVIVILLVLTVGAAEGSRSRPAQRVRHSRVYEGGRRRVIDVAKAAWGRRASPKVPDLPPAATAPPPAPPRAPRARLDYPPPAAPSPASGAAAPAGSAPVVDFFAGLLAVVNAPYEKPNDALRQLRVVSEGGRGWNNGLVRLHQRMSDPGDMRIDPFVSDHVVRAAAFCQAMVLELVDADAAMTALLNMTLSEIQERGLQVPNTK